MKRFNPIWMPKPGSLGARALNAGGWNLFSTIATYALRLGSNLITTRFLMPEAFGMVIIGAMLITALSLFTDIGFQKSIAREPDGEEPHFLRVVWVAKIIRGAIVAFFVLIAAVLMWLLAPALAPEGSVYAQPQMPGVIALAGLSPLMIGAGSTAWELTMRRLDYRRFVVFEIIAQILSTVAMVLFALVSPTVWALLAGMLTASFFQMVFSHLFMPGPRMRFEWDREIAARIWHFGKWLLGSSSMTFINRSADRFILGALFDATSFGIYVIAFIWFEAGRGLLTKLTGKVGFPVIAEVIRSRPKEVPRLYGKYQKAIDAICTIGFLCALLIGQPIMVLLYEPPYEDAGAYVQLMAPIFLFMRYFAQSDLMINMGDTFAAMIVQVIRAVTTCLGIPLGYMLFGVEGAILGVVASFAAPVPYILMKTRSFLGAKQSRNDWIWFAASCILTIAVYATLAF